MTEESDGKSLLRKIRFLEWLSTRSDVAGLELRLSVFLVSRYNAKRGFAWPSLEQMEDSLGARQTNLVRAINSLEEKGVFNVTRGGGRGRANEYRPRFDRVPEGDIYEAYKGETLTDRRLLPRESVSQETLTKSDETLTCGSSNTDQQVSPSVLSSALSPTAPMPRRAPQVARAPTVRLNWEDPMASLKAIERAMETGEACKGDLERWCDFASDIADSHDGHQGDPIGGLAKRLSADLSWALEEVA